MSNAALSSQARKRAALYCRVSTADQRCERQELDLLAYADRAGLEGGRHRKRTIKHVKLWVTVEAA